MVDAPVKLFQCPDCGAPLKPTDTACWMCLRGMARQGDGFVGVGERPVLASPFAPQTGVRYQTNVPALVGIVLLAVGIVPATLVAGTVSCLAAASTIDASGQNVEAVFGVGLLGGVVCAVVIVVLIGVLSTKVTRVIRY